MNVTALGVWGEERGERWLSWNQNRNCANAFKVGAELDSSKDTFYFIPILSENGSLRVAEGKEATTTS